MNINLIFPPSIGLACVPLGIASLKAYIEKYSADINVTLIDLNLFFANRILGGGLIELNNICRRGNISCKNKNNGCLFQSKLLKEQVEIFKKAKVIIKEKDLFFDREIFKRFVGDCYKYISSANNCIEKILKNYLEEKFNDEKIIIDIFREELERVTFNKPDIIGFSILVDGQFLYALALAKILKQRFKTRIIFGGPALFNYNIKEAICIFKFIDFVVLKEGEEAIVGLLKNIQTIDYKNVPNLIWKKGLEVISNDNNCIKDLDSLPTPNFNGLALKEYFYPELILPLATSRGCPWAGCKFCQLNAQYSGGYRQRSINSVIEDIRHLNKKFGANNFFLSDSEISSHRLKELGIAIIKSKLKIYFACYARPTKDLTFDTIKTVYTAGGRFFQLGVESFSNRCLDFVSKGTTAQSIKEVLKNTDRVKIKNLVYMIAGIPSQTENELLFDFKTIAMMQMKYKIFSVIYCLYSLGEYQKFYRELKKLDIVIKSKKTPFMKIDGCNIYRVNRITFSYRNKGAYDVLQNSSKDDSINSKKRAEKQLLFLCNKSGINGKDRDFITQVNNFLFETQLLFSKRIKINPSSAFKNRTIRFYGERKAILLYLHNKMH